MLWQLLLMWGGNRRVVRRWSGLRSAGTSQTAPAIAPIGISVVAALPIASAKRKAVVVVVVVAVEEAFQGALSGGRLCRTLPLIPQEGWVVLVPHAAHVVPDAQLPGRRGSRWCGSQQRG